MDCHHDAGERMNLDKYSDECMSFDASYISNKGDLTARLDTVLNSVKLFFTSLSLKSNISSGSSTMSSGYGSLDSSWELDESYVKVSKFSHFEESGEFGHFGTYKEYKEMALHQRIATDIKSIVESSTQRRMQISDCLTLRTANDVINLSKCEPYGLKGCKLILMIQDKDEIIVKRCIYPERGLMSTFEITLVLHLKKHMCHHFKIFDNRTFHILEQYELRKEKLYTSKQRRVHWLSKHWHST